jgi:hypothetical protein
LNSSLNALPKKCKQIKKQTIKTSGTVKKITETNNIHRMQMCPLRYSFALSARDKWNLNQVRFNLVKNIQFAINAEHLYASRAFCSW